MSDENSHGYKVFGIELHIWAQYITLFCMLCSNVLSFYNIYLHIHYPHLPNVRGRIIRILLMVNLYSVEAWFGLLVPSLDHYLGIFSGLIFVNILSKLYIF